jgi:arabinofuranosyltransferase
MTRRTALTHRSPVAWLSSDRGRRGVAAAIYAAALAYACVSLWRYPRWTVDDAYIVFRYARHLVEHGQLTWTVGADPVEGYTGIALPLFAAAGMRLGFAPWDVVRAIGIASFFFAAWTVRDNQRRLGVPEPIRAYVTAIALIFPPFHAHATSGLETMLFVGTLGACFGALLSCDVSPRPGRQALLWLELLFLSLVRPEGLLFAGIFGGALALRVRRDREARRVAPVIALTLFAAPYGAYFAWRVAYYGRLFPNTYYAKKLETGFNDGFVRPGAVLVEEFLPLLIVALVATLLARRVRLPRPPVVAGLAAVFLLAVQYSRSALIMGYLFRFQVHTLFILLPLMGTLLASVHPGEARRLCGTAKGAAIEAFLLVCLVVWPVEAIATAGAVRAQAQRYLDCELEQGVPLATWIRDKLPDSEAVACWIDAGLIPFMADAHRYIDFGRLNDEYLANPRRTRAEIADYFFDSDPGALVLASEDAAGLAPLHEGRIITEDPRFGRYQRKSAFCSVQYPNAPCEVLFLRRGLEEQ